MNEKTACGGAWEEHRKKLFTPEEIAESDLRVERIIKDSQDTRPYDHIWDMYYDEFEDLEE
jgi:hypothetical protein